MHLADENIDRGWAILKENYDIRRHIVNSQFELFFGSKKLQKRISVKLQHLLRVCLECESAFHALNMDATAIGANMFHSA